MRKWHKQREPQPELLKAIDVDIDTPTGRALFRSLNLSLGYEKVALIGRNGVGKSTLMEVLSQRQEPLRGRVINTSESLLVSQDLRQSINTLDRQSCFTDFFSDLEIFAAGYNDELIEIGLSADLVRTHLHQLSHGELRKLWLLAAKLRNPQLLLLDEPSEDLDEKGFAWLSQYLKSYANGLVLISHEVRLLRNFHHFFLLSETGCDYFHGSFADLQNRLEKQQQDWQQKYLRHLHHLNNKEQHNMRIAQRREQKKNQGRLRELGRMTPKLRLNKKRSYAQESQGRVAKISQQRIQLERAVVKNLRRNLRVDLAMQMPMPELAKDTSQALVVLEDVSLIGNKQVLFRHLNLTFKRQRFAILGPNGSGKTTLLKTILKQYQPASGKVFSELKKIASIAQGATNWMLDESLVSCLLAMTDNTSIVELQQLLQVHQFPLALAQRPLKDLSPGERVRAAFMCLLAKTPAAEFLLLDEPTFSLDFVGYSALREGLKLWPGGLALVSHDREFLQYLGIQYYLQLDGKGGWRVLNAWEFNLDHEPK